MLKFFFWCCVAAGFIVGMLDGLKNMGYLNNNNKTQTDTVPIQLDTPYYIEDQINALYSQIAAYNELIVVYREQLELTYDKAKAAVIRRKISDIEYKCSRLEEKVNKLLDKWEY